MHSGGSAVHTATEVFKCTGNETQLEKCPRSSTTHQDCTGHNNVTLICSGDNGPRLVGGENRCSGRVEVLHGEQWGTLCGVYFGLQDANVVCEHLFCGTAKSIPRDARFGRGARPVWKENYECHGNERRLWNCPVSHGESFNCLHGNMANVICSDENWALSLVNGESRCDGRVEVYYNGSWGGVQDTVWDQNDANVVCRQLGCGYASEIYNSSKYGESDGGSWVHVVKCLGHESQLQDCRISNTLNSSVTEGSGVGVLCLEHKELRLVNGKHRCEGRVEVFYNGTWGTVCSDTLDSHDAKVICKQLHCGALQYVEYDAQSFGAGTGTIWLDEMECLSHESTLWQCHTDPWGQHDCQHRDDAGVVCSGNMTSLLNVRVSFQT
ncbi:scavenger receptor cysteine-rich type 1 protein M130-like [Chiloscyllium punctatum]|uniref:scavenger receptor cysteine-rich type 1 protein M130-like n=1 Tax=Chiloscyllium punctatum TaxID=137246 RepID=UPI003B63BBEF